MSLKDRVQPAALSALALTGGGVLGLYTALLLDHLHRLREETHGPEFEDATSSSNLADAFDVVAGTSIGALIAAGIVRSIRPSRIASLIEASGPKVFPRRSQLRRLILTFGSAWFSQRHLLQTVSSVLGDARLGDLAPRRLIIPALDETSGRPIIFDSHWAPHADIRLTDAVLASAAAPIYLPAHRFQFEDRHCRFVDGGLFANAPDLIAIERLRHRWPSVHPKAIRVVSVGTTNVSSSSPRHSSNLGDWGVAQWIFGRPKARLLKLMLRAVTDHAIQAAPLTGVMFLRLDTNLPANDAEGLDIDNATPKALSKLRALAKDRILSLSMQEKDSLRLIVSGRRFEN